MRPLSDTRGSSPWRCPAASRGPRAASQASFSLVLILVTTLSASTPGSVSWCLFCPLPPLKLRLWVPVVLFVKPKGDHPALLSITHVKVQRTKPSFKIKCVW